MEENAALQRKANHPNASPRPSTSTTNSSTSENSHSTPVSTPRKNGTDPTTPRSAIAASPLERRRDLLETLNTIAGIAKALETKLKPQA